MIYKTTTLKELKNPIYSADDATSVPPHNFYETVDSEAAQTKEVINILYNIRDENIPGAAVPSQAGPGGEYDAIADINFYSAVGPSGSQGHPQQHSTEPNQPPLSDTGYSCLQHK